MKNRIYLPKVDKLLYDDEFKDFFKPMLLKLIQEILDEERKAALEKNSILNIEDIKQKIKNRYEKEFALLEQKPLINATGIVIHTNLGRSIISKEIVNKAACFISSYSNLEFSLENGKRADRYKYTNLLFKLLFKDDSLETIIVNNNASAVFLILNTFAKDRQTIVSRGELVEIGGSFRIPEVMSNSGTTLKEIGTTNKTKLKDYKEAINDQTAMLMKVHRSNFSVEGFSEEVEIKELVDLASLNSLMSYYDLGSAYINELAYGLSTKEPDLKTVLKANPSLLSFSGDKLFGSVQCGIIIGKKEHILKLKQNQLFRMLRVDKITLSFLNETLKAYLQKEFNSITTINQIHKPLDELLKEANFVKDSIKLPSKVLKTKTYIGGGAIPSKSYPSVALSFDKKCLGYLKSKYPSDQNELLFLQEIFRKNLIIGRVEEDKFLLDFRTILQKDIEPLIQTINRMIKNA